MTDIDASDPLRVQFAQAFDQSMRQVGTWVLAFSLMGVVASLTVFIPFGAGYSVYHWVLVRVPGAVGKGLAFASAGLTFSVLAVLAVSAVFAALRLVDINDDRD